MKTCALLLPLLAVSAEAATLTGSFVAFGGAAALPSGTNTDWGYFDPSATAVASLNATNTSNTGTRLFNVTAAGTGTLVRGSASDSDNSFSYGDGTSPGSATTQKVGGVFSSLIGPGGEGSGVKFSADSFSVPSLIELYTYEFRASGTLRVYLNADTTALYTQQIITGGADGSKDGQKFSFNFTPDGTGDSLRFEYIMDDAVGDNSTANLGFQAIAISPIPEPGSLLLLALTGLPLAIRRRR